MELSRDHFHNGWRPCSQEDRGPAGSWKSRHLRYTRKRLSGLRIREVVPGRTKITAI